MEENNIEISETNNYPELVRFFVDNGLEFSAEDEISTDIVKCWKATGRDSGKLLGGCVLARRDGRYICDGMATDPQIRGLGLGSSLLAVLIAEAKVKGADALFLVARVPEFYRKNGFLSVPRENVPIFFECFSCAQYGVTCEPEVMRLDL